MKKFLALGMLSFLSGIAFAQGAAEPIMISDATARKISIDGKWIGCHGMTILIYNLETGESETYPNCSLGIGNCMAIDGTTVGSYNDLSVLMRNGEVQLQRNLINNGFNGINGITPDGTKVVGFVKNPDLIGVDASDVYDMGIPVYLPFYAELGATGSIEDINVLPVPEKDFLGLAPQKVTGEWISEDGKIILGTITDSYGRFEDPIVYHLGENGEWSYILPTKEFNNPNGIVLPENPEDKMPPEPVYKDYMGAVEYEAYLEALQDYFYGGGPEVDPFEFMTDEEIEKYLKDYEAYVNYFEDHREEFRAYEAAYREILATSKFFGESALDPLGKILATSAVDYDTEDSYGNSQIFIIDALSGEYKEIKSKFSGLKIHQVLSDGTVIAYSGLFTYEPLQGYILLPGEDDFMPFANYLSATNTYYYDWLETTFPYGEGIISASDDLAVVAGGVDILHVEDYDEYPDVTLLSYVFPDMKSAGVEAIELPVEDGVYRVYNLVGVKVLETKEKSELNKLAKGIYIINGKKISI